MTSRRPAVRGLMVTWALAAACAREPAAEHQAAPLPEQARGAAEARLAPSDLSTSAADPMGNEAYVSRLRKAHDAVRRVVPALERPADEQATTDQARFDPSPNQVDPSRGAIEEALAELERTFALPGSGPRETVMEARRDLANQAARLLLLARRPKEALAWSERGLDLDPEPPALRAGLLITRADAWEALAEPGRARESLLEALLVNQTLLKKELETP